MRELPMIACSLDAGGQAERGAEFRRLFDEALISRERIEHGAILTFRQDAAGAVRDLFAREKECCPWWGFTISETADAVTVRVEAPAEADALVDVLLGLGRR